MSNIKKSKSTYLFYAIGFTTVAILVLFCLIPFLLVISGSLTSEAAIANYGFTLIPKQFSVDAYTYIFIYPKTILQAYGVTTVNTVVGSLLGVYIIAMTGYVLQRPDCKYRNKISFYIYFTTLFQGGLIPWYILLTKYYHLKDNRLVLILPMLMTPFLIILMKNFIKISVPHEIIESAKIDGAGDFKIFNSIVLKLALPGLATIGLFLALAYWNDWYLSSLYISTPAKYSLQFYLYNMLNSMTAMRQLSQVGQNISVELPSESLKFAMAVICTGPIVFLYPFIQKYFVKGLTIGAVKG